MTYEDLLEYKDVKKEIERIKERIKSLELQLSTPSSPKFDSIPIAAPITSSGLEINVLKLIELKDLYKELADRLIGKQLAIEKEINQLAPLERDIVRLRYFDNMSWDEIAHKICYSYRHTVRMHRRIIKKLCGKE